MNEWTLSLSLAGVLGLVLVGLILYARLSARRNGAGIANRSVPEAGQPAISPAGEDGLFDKIGLVGKVRLAGKYSRASSSGRDVASSEQLVDVVDILENRYFLTTGGSLVALFSLRPVLTTTSSSPEGLAENFVSLLHALEPKSSFQFVQLPLPSPEGATLAERYAIAGHAWHEEAARNETGPAANRYFAAAEIAGQILQVGTSSARRMTVVVLSRPVGLKTASKAGSEGLRKAMDRMQVEEGRLLATFEANGMPITPMEANAALEILWQAYHPGLGSQAQLETEQERLIETLQTGQTPPPISNSLSPEQIERILTNPQGELRRMLAPMLLEERERSLRFEGSEMLLYFITDFRVAVPTIHRLLGRGGQFAGRLWVSYYVTSPSSDEMARATRRASTAKQALQSIAWRAGSLPSYRQAEEVASIEEARAGAETEKNVTKLLGLYLGLLTTPERAEVDAQGFEQTLRSAGVEFVPAQWMALSVWRTLLPLGQRFHTFEERNLFPANLAPLIPATATSLLDTAGEFCGFLAWGENAGAPVAVRRERGGEFVPSDAVVGAQNSGKSFTLKLWVADWIARGHGVFVVDPKLEFDALTRVLGGTLLPMGGVRGFNLLQFELLPATPGSDLGASIAQLVFEENLAALVALYSLAKGRPAWVTGVERNLLTNALKGAMGNSGMDPKDAATWQPNRVFLSDVYEVLTGEIQKEDPQTVHSMAQVLEQYASKSGQFFERYNTPNDFSLEADLVTATFGLSQLNPDTTGRAIAAHFVMRLAVNRAVRAFLLSKKPIPYHIVIDEASQLLTSPALVSSVVSMLSLLSAYGISVHLAFQTMEAISRADELGAVEGASSLNTLSGVIPAYWLFHQEPQSAETAARLLEIPPEEARFLVRNRVGECILVFPKSSLRIPLAIRVPEAFHPLFKTDPASMRAQIEQALARPEPVEQRQRG